MTREEAIKSGTEKHLPFGLVDTNYKGEVYTVREAANKMNCSLTTLYKRAERGEIELAWLHGVRGYVTKQSVDKGIAGGIWKQKDKHKPNAYKGRKRHFKAAKKPDYRKEKGRATLLIAALSKHEGEITE